MKKILLAITFMTISCISFCFAQTPEQKLRDLNIELKTPRTPIANYVNLVKVGELVFLSGKGPELHDGTIIQGKVGQELSKDEGKSAARITAINLISVLKHELGDLSRIDKFVKINGMVNAIDGFTEHPYVINGASDLIVEVFGDEVGKHSRVAIGVHSLPFNIPVEIDIILKIKK